MTLMSITKARSRQGRRRVDAIAGRGAAIVDSKLLKSAEKIVERVRHRGDKALLQAVRKYDGHRARSVEELRLKPLAVGRRELPPGFESAVERAIAGVERYHEKQRREGSSLADDGVEIRELRRPIRRVGVYIPGGRYAYPSSAVMTVVPARLAGVEEIVVATPAKSFRSSPALRHTLERLGIREVWGVGGAQAIAALAYGTETIPRVDKIVGPGNAWVTAAKYLVSLDVAIDGLSGPTEVVIVASAEADAERIAADLLAQAEHDPQALVLLITDSKSLAKSVAREVDRQLRELSTAPVAREAVKAGGVLLVADLEEAHEMVERIAPEHLQLMGRQAEALAEKVRNAGAIFVGEASPEVLGDYVAGPSHVLPTGGTARFASALGVEDFVRRSHLVRFDPVAASRAAAAAATLADLEGLPGHAASARLRLRGETQGEAG